jgi:hypothetical protein
MSNPTSAVAPPVSTTKTGKKLQVETTRNRQKLVAHTKRKGALRSTAGINLVSQTTYR